MRDIIGPGALAGLKGLLGAFLRFVTRETTSMLPRADRPLRRWSSEELERVKTYLESERSEPRSFDDQMLEIEWIHQKWWPADEVRTVAQWEAAKATYALRIRHAKAFHGPSDWQIELEVRRRQDLQVREYRLSLADFERLVIPVVLQHPCSPDSFDGGMVCKLWRTISPSQFERRDAFDELGFWPTPLEVIKTAQRVGYFVQALLAARAAGHQVLRIHPTHCECRMGQFQEDWTVDGLLQRVENAESPTLPPADSRCRILTEDDDECRAWCAMYFTPLDHARRPPCDPEFERALEEISRRHRAMWAQQARNAADD